jgi:plastocyanin
VQLKAITFEPDTVTIKVGEAVRWVWEGGVQHNVNGGDVFKSKLQSKGEFVHTFDKAGSFDYRCDVHPTTMKGKVVVT